MAEEETPQAPSESEEALLGSIPVKLQKSGVVVHVEPWGIRTGRRVLGRIKDVMQLARVADGNITIDTIVDAGYDEAVQVVAESLHWDADELEEKADLADFVALLEAVIRVNFIDRPGMAKNVMSLLGLLNKMTGGPDDEDEEPETLTPSPPPSSS